MRSVYRALFFLGVATCAAQDGANSDAPPEQAATDGGTGGGCDDGTDAFVARVQAAQQELTAAREAMEQAVTDKDFGAAAEHQARELELAAALDALKLARVSACGASQLLEPAADMDATVTRAWQARLDQLLGPLEPAINTTLAIVQQSIRLAAEAGRTRVEIGSPSNAPNAQKSHVPAECTSCYGVDLTFCQVLVGPGLSEAQLNEYYQGNARAKQQGQRQSYDGAASVAETPAASGLGSQQAAIKTQGCSESTLS